LNGRTRECALDEDAERISGWRLSHSSTENFWFTVRMGRDRTRVHLDASAETRRVDVGAAAEIEASTHFWGLKIESTASPASNSMCVKAAKFS
jgi:hypothetical protein